MTDIQNSEYIEQAVKNCSVFFAKHRTLSYEFRIKQLSALQKSIAFFENEILQALGSDLHKSRVEAFMTELGPVHEELHTAIKKLRRWMSPKRVKTPAGLWIGKSFILHDPLGTVLIMSPWNYPVNLTLVPLIGAIAAGNCTVLKPSNYAPQTAAVLSKIIRSAFPPEYVCMIEGGREKNAALLEQRFDYIFFTGSESVGKLVMQSAAKNLTPLTLELGGKSPCILAPDADTSRAAKRILFGKFLNAGQTCVAPDYLLVHADKKQAFFEAAKKILADFFPTEEYKAEYFPHIVNEKHFDRLMDLIKNETCIVGGSGKRSSKFIEPTILDHINFDSPVMQQEIFGPILPVISYTDINEIINILAKKPKPLALYLFTQDSSLEKKVLQELSFGGGSINDTLVHIANANLPFGGSLKAAWGNITAWKVLSALAIKKVYIKNMPYLICRFVIIRITKKRLACCVQFLKRGSLNCALQNKESMLR